MMKLSTVLAVALISFAFAAAACEGNGGSSLTSRTPVATGVRQSAPTPQIVEQEKSAQVIPKEQPTQAPILLVNRQMTPEELVVAMDEVLNLDPDNADAYYERGRAHHRLGNLLHAIEDFSEAILIDPAHASAYNHRGLVFKSLGQINLAFNDMMEAASMVEALGRFDMESMIIGFLTDGQVVPAGDP